MLTPSDEAALLNELLAQEREQLEAMAANEPWRVDGDPEAEAALAELSAALERAGDLDAIGAADGLGVGAALGTPRALLWLRTLLERGPASVERMLAPALGEDVNQQILYQRLVQIGRRRILARVLSEENRAALARAHEAATRGGS